MITPSPKRKDKHNPVMTSPSRLHGILQAILIKFGLRSDLPALSFAGLRMDWFSCTWFRSFWPIRASAPS